MVAPTTDNDWSGMTDAVLGGWQLTGIHAVQSGLGLIEHLPAEWDPRSPRPVGGVPDQVRFDDKTGP